MPVSDRRTRHPQKEKKMNEPVPDLGIFLKKQEGKIPLLKLQELQLETAAAKKW